MLGTHEATATIAHNTQEQEAVLYNAGRSGLLVYKSDYAGQDPEGNIHSLVNH